jgi:hypothetical protein
MKKEILEKKLKRIKEQMFRDSVLVVIAIFVLIFIPLVYIEDQMFKISIENIIAFVVLIGCFIRGFHLKSRKDELEDELSVYKEKETKQKTEGKKASKKETEPRYFCEYCRKTFKSKEALNNHKEHCKVKEEKIKKEKKILAWVLGTIIFFGFFLYFMINNKINIVPLVLISLLITPFFDMFFKWYKQKSKRLSHVVLDWRKKSIAIGVIIISFVLINLFIPKCPETCNDDNPCTIDLCSSETGYKCMNTVKLNCDGNSICEIGEYGKSADCPDCDDGNKCTADSYDPGSKQCIHIEIIGCDEKDRTS